MDTLLITGGAGFIGANLVQHVLEHTTSRIVVVDALTYAANPLALRQWTAEPRITFLKADIGQESTMRHALTCHRPSAVLNLAAETHVDRSIDAPRTFLETNVTGTFALLEAARRYVEAADADIRARFRFLHVSTDEVYGSLSLQGGRFTETTPYAPNSPYAASKASADHLVRAYHHTYGLATLITNCSNNYGPYQHPEKLIPLTILNALDARPLRIYGDGANVRDWLHVDDHCAAIRCVLGSGQPGEHYNVGADNEQSNVAVVDGVCRILEELHPAADNPAMRRAGVARYADLKQFVPDRPGHDRRYAIDASKLQRTLGWTPRRTFQEGLRETVRWYVVHREWFDAVRIGYDRQRLGLGALTPPNASDGVVTDNAQC